MNQSGTTLIAVDEDPPLRRPRVPVVVRVKAIPTSTQAGLGTV
jgi:hypothetical protein